MTSGAYPWVPDQGDGTYRNPILYADYADPDVIRHGDDFYLTASSFHCTPGLPILHSCDLVNWTLIAHAVQNLPHPRYRAVQKGQGIWAPALRHYAGRFWIFFATPDEGIYVTTADNPTGPWSEPHLVQAGKGLIDPCPLWDDDGRAYLVHAYAASRCGIKHVLRVRPMAPDGTHLLGEGQIVFDAPERHPTVEGPKFLKRDGWYYILAPAGGVENGWQLALRSRDIYGPYEAKVVLEQGMTTVNGPHQGALVETSAGESSAGESSAGESWFLHFQDAGVYGRIIHLQPVHWQDGWPLMGVDQDGNGVGEPVARCRKPNVTSAGPIAVPATSDLFQSETLGLQWQWNANHESYCYSLTARPHHLRLFSQLAPGSDLSDVPSLLLQKFPATSFTVETVLEFFPDSVAEEAGLVVLGRRAASLGLQKTVDGFHIVCRAEGTEVALPTASPTIRLGVRVGDDGHCQFIYALGDGDVWTSVAPSFQADKGHWIGARVGLYSITQSSTAGHADFSSFLFR